MQSLLLVVLFAPGSARRWTRALEETSSVSNVAAEDCVYDALWKEPSTLSNHTAPIVQTAGAMQHIVQHRSTGASTNAKPVSSRNTAAAFGSIVPFSSSISTSEAKLWRHLRLPSGQRIRAP